MASTVEGERTRRWRPTRVIVLVALLIAAGLVAAAGIRDALQSSNARTALSDYLKDVQRGDFSGAYGQLCDAVKTDYTQAAHVRFLKEQPAFSSFELDNQTTETSGSGGTVITFSVHFTDLNGGSRVARMSVNLQGNGPHVCDGPNSRQLQ